MANLFRWFWDYLLWLFWYAIRGVNYPMQFTSWSSSTEKELANFPVFFKGYGNGGHNRWFAKCREDFTTSRSCSKCQRRIKLCRQEKEGFEC
jgi:hypothetical protein